MIAAAPIIKGIFSPDRTVGLALHGLGAGRIALNQNSIGMFRRGHQLKRRRQSQQLVTKQAERNNRDGDNECGKLPFAPVRKDLARRKVRRSFHSLRRHFERPRNCDGKNEPERDQDDERLQHPRRRVEIRQENPRDLDQQPSDDGINERDFINVAPLQFREQRRLSSHEAAGKPSLASKFLYRGSLCKLCNSGSTKSANMPVS